jgi:hypothetical protein
MRRFADFAEPSCLLDGEKIRIDDVVNREIAILNYSVRESRFSKNKSGNYLTLQVEIDNERRVLFTGSDVLIEQMEQYGDKVPFIAIIKKVDKFYTLS